MHKLSKWSPLVIQEVEKVLFLVMSLSHLRGCWQMAQQAGPATDAGHTLHGPLGMRQACCSFLDFAALAIQHQQQPYCPPVSPQEQVGTHKTKPQICFTCLLMRIYMSTSQLGLQHSLAKLQAFCMLLDTTHSSLVVADTKAVLHAHVQFSKCFQRACGNKPSSFAQLQAWEDLAHTHTSQQRFLTPKIQVT